MKYLLIISFFISSHVFAQKKEYTISRVNTPPIIDGNIKDGIWKSIPFTGNFIQYTPENGKPIAEKFNTQWKAVYDNQAVYFAVFMMDPNPDSIMTQLRKRDAVSGSNNDEIKIRINPYMDGQTDFVFSLSPQGVQQDEKSSSEYNEINWDMVWFSETSVDAEGWYAEFKIPYSALRFPKQKVQDWSFNVLRHIRRYRETFSWNTIDLTNDNISSQAGIIRGFEDIEPPLRLSFFPYISSYATHYENEIDFSLNGGMDLKYGINESFTLDMTLIPDFGQVGFDNQVLNLSPFEVQYNEKRSFFTEGTELFSKSGLFYSRRISDQLINASKVTGKTKNNLGIGVLNAVTNETDDKPLSNYNIVTLDQSLKNNSYLSLTNTNVYRQNKDYANVTGLNTAIKNKENSLQTRGSIKLSQKKESEDKTVGFASYAEVAKISGNFQYYISNNIESDTYDHNDMGFLYNNNEFSNYAGISYTISEPTKYLVDFDAYLNTSYKQLFNPLLFVSWEIDAKQVSTFKNYLTWGLSTQLNLKEKNDYFESRTTIDDVFKVSESYTIRTFFSSDYRKRIALDVSFGGGEAPLYNEKTHFFRLSPRIRVNDKFFMYYVFSTETVENESGYITTNNDKPIFSIRNKQFFTNVISGQYVLNTKMSFDFKFRHHWEQVKNYSFHELDENGYLAYSDYNENKDVNFNAWNIDLNFNYWFAPGSELSIVWKNAILTQSDQVLSYYNDNLEALLNNPQENSLSLRLRYYLDYSYFKKK